MLDRRSFLKTDRDRALARVEIRALWAKLAEFVADETIPAVCAHVIMLLLTGMRIGELLTAEWRDVALEQRWLRLREAKSGKRSVPLNRLALTELAALAAPRTSCRARALVAADAYGEAFARVLASSTPPPLPAPERSAAPPRLRAVRAPEALMPERRLHMLRPHWLLLSGFLITAACHQMRPPGATPPPPLSEQCRQDLRTVRSAIDEAAVYAAEEEPSPTCTARRAALHALGQADLDCPPDRMQDYAGIRNALVSEVELCFTAAPQEPAAGR